MYLFDHRKANVSVRGQTLLQYLVHNLTVSETGLLSPAVDGGSGCQGGDQDGVAGWGPLPRTNVCAPGGGACVRAHNSFAPFPNMPGWDGWACSCVGFYLDDYWSDGQTPIWGKVIRAGAGDLDGTEIPDIGLAPADLATLQQSWLSNMAVVNAAVLAHDGFTWQMMTNSGWGSAPAAVTKETCVTALRGNCPPAAATLTPATPTTVKPNATTSPFPATAATGAGGVVSAGDADPAGRDPADRPISGRGRPTPPPPLAPQNYFGTALNYGIPVLPAGDPEFDQHLASFLLIRCVVGVSCAGRLHCKLSVAPVRASMHRPFFCLLLV